MPIPKKIVTYWLNDQKGLTPQLEKWVETQKLPGYEHFMITLDNCDRSSEYVRKAIEKKMWVKATDFLRIQYLYNFGGLALDTDMEVLSGKNFDDLLDCRLFTSFECMGLYANAGFGSAPCHPILKAYLDRVENNYKGDGDLTYEPGIRTFHDIFWAADKSTFRMIPTEVFFPYNHATGITNITPLTKVIHHYSKSWLAPVER